MYNNPANSEDYVYINQREKRAHFFQKQNSAVWISFISVMLLQKC